MSEQSQDQQMRSISPASINSLQIALFSLKDRCTKQQKRIEDLESENSMINTSRADLYNELKKLHESNVKLREKNVGLSHELHLKSKDLSETREVLERDRSRNKDNVKQLEKLQQDILRRTDPEKLDADDDCGDNEMISSIPPVSVIEGREDQMISLLDSGKSSICNIKLSLLKQQDQLKKALESLKQKKSVSDQSAEDLISAILTATVSNSQAGEQGAKCCPMCEVLFPKNISQSEFETHVMEHFNYEESDTLRNFDTVPDALWPGIEHNPEL